MKKAQAKNDRWNANLYDIKHSFVSQYGNHLVELLAPQKGERILDLGCGTGDLANKLANLECEIIGVDQSPNMIQQAKEKFPHIDFSVQDATKLSYHNEFDAVFSNAVLHWIKEPSAALHCIFHSLKQGGRFVAEFGGKGNVQKITNEIMKQFATLGMTEQAKKFPWYYPSIGEYSALMEEIGFRVTFAQHIDRPTPLDSEHGLRNWIEMFGDTMFEGVTEEIKEIIITKVEQNLKERLYIDGQWVADYKRIRVIGVKE